ncbi:MAG: MarR family transcriptional regulator, partial [Bacteroidetes bacterium]|nr:MarR family transcriptional regulator [Bacteroidota bacterium]
MEETQQHYSRILTEFFDRMSSWEQGLVEGSGISLSQMHVLETLGNHRKLRMKELAEKLGVTTGTLTVMV